MVEFGSGHVCGVLLPEKVLPVCDDLCIFAELQQKFFLTTWGVFLFFWDVLGNVPIMPPHMEGMHIDYSDYSDSGVPLTNTNVACMAILKKKKKKLINFLFTSLIFSFCFHFSECSSIDSRKLLWLRSRNLHISKAWRERRGLTRTLIQTTLLAWNIAFPVIAVSCIDMTLEAWFPGYNSFYEHSLITCTMEIYLFF